ncbi:hypothetical protein XJ44_04755 [Thermosipho affectus]|uniref:Uncharacterized protein n=2 Tax=Thermosipho affectus TaxID=660294 RepID=A0ABX3IH01_9BACT|nr:hypothetical protein XJ44_04755 [Thermosipho affectus]
MIKIRKILSFFEIVLLFIITFMISINRWFSIFYLLPIFFELYKDMFSKEVDEFERLVRYKTSNIVLYIVICMSVTFLLLGLFPTRDIYYFYILFPLLLRSLLYIGYFYRRKRVIKVTGYTLFIMLSIFILLSHGFTKESLFECVVPLLILISTWVSIYYRLVGGVMFFGYFLVFSFYIFRGTLNVGKVLVYSLLGTVLLFLSVQSVRKEEKI